jgi:hypothetical protein
MEVHHHGHVHEKKKWKEYVFQFFMLFLAVLCGFLAEYQLEHVVENNRAKQYAVNLVQDLKMDTIQLHENITRNKMISEKLDTLRKIIYSSKTPNISGGSFYYYGRYSTWYNRFTPNDATFQQMKNSGGIRYFHNNAIESKISKYDKSIRQLLFHEAGEYDGLNDMWQINSELFYGNISDSLFDLDKPRSYYESFMSNNHGLLNNDQILLIKLANLCRARQMWITYKINESYEPALKLAREVIAALKKEYHLQ